MQDLDQKTEHLRRGSVLIPPGINRYNYRRRINGKYHYKSLKTNDFDTAYEHALDYEKMKDIEFLRALKCNVESQNFMTFSDAYDLFREHRMDCPEATTKTNDSRFKCQEPRIGALQVESITTFVIEKQEV